MKEKVRWGILGPGIIAHEFVQDFAHVTNAELEAVASRSADRAQEFAAQYGIPKAYEGYAGLYDDPDIDAIYIATPHNFHFEQVSKALEAGKSVLCEKPITINQTECVDLVALAKQRNHYLMEGMWTYFLPAIQKAQEWIQAGRIGKVLHLKSSFGYPVPYDPESRYYSKALSGGSLLDMGVYPVAMVCLFLGHEPTKVHSIQQLAETGVDKDTLVTLEYEGKYAHLHSSFQCKLNNHTYIIGEDGYIDIPDFWRAQTCSLYKIEEKIDQFEDHRSGNGFEFQIQHVSNELLLGKTQPSVVTHETSLAFQRLMDAMKKATP